MVSIIIAIALGVISYIGMVLYDKKKYGGMFYSSFHLPTFFCLISLFFLVAFGIGQFGGTVDRVVESKVFQSGDELYYIDEKDNIHRTSIEYVKMSSEYDEPTYVTTYYDNTYFIKLPNSQLYVPTDFFESR